MICSEDISKSMHEFLIEHLTEIEEEKLRVIEEYYPEDTDEKFQFETMINIYTKKIKKLVAETARKPLPEYQLPFVTIDSVVEVEDLDYDEIEKFQIVSPFNPKSEGNKWNYASYLSPIGRSLLLKKKGDNVKISIPNGIIRFKIKSINFPFMD